MCLAKCMHCFLPHVVCNSFSDPDGFKLTVPNQCSAVQLNGRADDCCLPSSLAMLKRICSAGHALAALTFSNRCNAGHAPDLQLASTVSKASSSMAITFASACHLPYPLHRQVAPFLRACAQPPVQGGWECCSALARSSADIAALTPCFWLPPRPSTCW